MAKIPNCLTYPMELTDAGFDPNLWKVDLAECSISHPTGWKFIFYLSDTLIGECITMPKSCVGDDLLQADITMSAMECYMAVLKCRH